MADAEMTETADYDKSADPTDHALTHELGASDEINAVGLDHKSTGRAFLNNNQSIPSNALTEVQFDTISFDRGNDFNIATHRFVAPSDGKYLIISSLLFLSLADQDLFTNSIYVNATPMTEITTTSGASGNLSNISSVIIDLAANDYVTCRVKHTNPSAKLLYQGLAINHISITRLY